MSAAHTAHSTLTAGPVLYVAFELSLGSRWGQKTFVRSPRTKGSGTVSAFDKGVRNRFRLSVSDPFLRLPFAAGVAQGAVGGDRPAGRRPGGPGDSRGPAVVG
jgi:hypothetical protein